MTLFDHEKLAVYRLAMDFAEQAQRHASSLPRGNGDLADQLRRASTSIVLNLAEGAGEFAAKDKARFYRMARRSATECAAVIELGVRLRMIDDGKAARELLLRIVPMTTALVRSTGLGAGATKTAGAAKHNGAEKANDQDTTSAP